MAGFSLRFGRLRGFVGSRDAEDSQYGSLQLGVTTYQPQDDDTEAYQTSYLEWGGRSDHLADVLTHASGNDVPVRTVVDAPDADRVYVGTVEMNTTPETKPPTLKVA